MTPTGGSSPRPPVWPELHMVLPHSAFVGTHPSPLKVMVSPHFQGSLPTWGTRQPLPGLIVARATIDIIAISYQAFIRRHLNLPSWR